MDNKKVKVRKSNTGLGVFALVEIQKDEIICMFDGEIYTEHDIWTDDLLDHTVQFADTKWRESKGIARCLNHSCDPNCGIKELFKVVAMRDIKKGEELLWDYEMTEKNEYNWRMNCKCGTKICRGVIGNYKYMPLNIRKKYKGYISEWLLNT